MNLLQLYTFNALYLLIFRRSRNTVLTQTSNNYSHQYNTCTIVLYFKLVFNDLKDEYQHSRIFNFPNQDSNVYLRHPNINILLSYTYLFPT